MSQEEYMQDFMKVFETLERWGPGSENETLKALSLLPVKPQKILEIGCGKGLSTVVLAKNTDALITAVDNQPDAVAELAEALQRQNLSSKVTTQCASMDELPFSAESFDLIWAEGCAYIIGVEKALNAWKPLLKNDGLMILSDAVWLTEQPSETAKHFWEKEYADMQNVETRLAQIEANGFKVIEHFSISNTSWENYFLPLKQRINELKPDMPASKALRDIDDEIRIFERYLGEFGYQFFIIQKQ